MKTIFKLIVFYLLVATRMYAQLSNHGLHFSVFNDAEEYKNATADSTKIRILSHYFKNKAEIEQFNSDYGFSWTTPDFVSVSRENNDVVIQGVFSSSAFTQSAGVDALGTFIAKRFKQEINIAFLNKFKEDLEEIPYLKDIFPTSHQVLQQSDPYNYPVFINALREAFDNDLNNFVKNLPDVVAKLDIKDAAIQSRLVLGASLLEIRNIVGFNAHLNYIIETDTAVSAEIKKYLKISAIGINMFKKTGTGSGSFMNAGDLAKLRDPELLKIYLPFLIRQNERYISDLGIRPADVKKLGSMLFAIQNDYAVLATETNRILSNNQMYKLALSDIYKGMDALIKSMDKTVIAFEANFGITVGADLKSVIKAGKSVTAIVGFVNDKKYGLALINLTDFIFDIDATKLTDDQKTMIKKYTTFIANCLDAKTKDELITALETSANPVGSYRIKRNSTFNIALNAYAGGFAGTNFGKSTVYGFTAPAGIYVGWGNLMKKDAQVNKSKKATELEKIDGKSFGFFFSLVDVGAVTAFRLKDNETEMADVSWSNVFSPGAYATFGFGKCPISINAGGQMGPELKSVAADGTPTFVEKEWFWRASIVIDISIFDFYTKQCAYKLKKQN